jgi:hypothetical protein
MMQQHFSQSKWAFYSRSIAVLAIGVALASCGGEGASPAPAVPPPPATTPPPPPPPSSAAPTVERDIDPAVTSAAISSNFSPYVAINPDPAVAAKNRLFVMLPGTGAVPRFYRFILRTGAPRGYHALGLTYPNDVAIGTLCDGSTVADCSGLARNEVVTGEDTSPLVSVNRANSIAGRLVALLTYLSATYPNEGWGQYLTNGQPNWSVITVGGHSQGSGHAAYLAKLFALDRTVMFSGPSDVGIAAGSTPPWLSRANVTPASRQYGFTHTGDTLVPLALATRNWGLIGLEASGAPVSVDTVASPFANSRQLTTSAAPNPATPASVDSATHASPVVDVATPLSAAGTPVYQPVWSYLAFP